jgi:BirA family transcriptional regulator, biotin operon repressor / biotin---[acetyl-CoA-carboxylase] ligase
VIFKPTIDAARLVAMLETSRIGRTVRSLAETASTNDACWDEWTRSGPAADGIVVLADYQATGRGRFSRRWLAPRASSVLLSTLLLQPREPLLIETLSLVAGVAACLAVRQASGAEIQLRWPNDLVCHGRKVGGILVESRQVGAGPASEQSPSPGPVQIAAVIGIGINCLQHAGHFPPDLRQKACSLDMVSAGAISRRDVALGLIRQLDHFLAEPSLPDMETVRSSWQVLAEPPGRRVCLIHAGRQFYGTTVDLDPTGGLLVELETGGRRIFPASTTTLEIPN